MVLTQKRLTIKELSLFSIILFYFRFGHHDNNENFINLFLMAHSKCLPSFKTLVAQIMKIEHVYQLLYLGKCIDFVINFIVLLLSY